MRSTTRLTLNGPSTLVGLAPQGYPLHGSDRSFYRPLAFQRGALQSLLGILPLSGREGENSHVQATSNTGTLERLLLAVLLTEVHQSRHFALGELDFLAAKRGEGDVSDLVGHFWLVFGVV